MTALLRSLAVLCLLAGCQGKTRVFENPVVGPPPPRLARGEMNIAAQDSGVGESAIAEPAEISEIQQTSYLEDPGPTLMGGPPGLVAARINGTPIFMSDVLSPYVSQLAPLYDELRRVQPNTAERDFRRQQLQLVQRDLPQYIDTMVLVDAVYSKLDAATKESVQKQIDEIFQQELNGMMQANKVRSVRELEALFADAGTSLANELQLTGNTLDEVRKSFTNKALSTQYLREAIAADHNPTRQELLDEYHARLDEYRQPARVKWQEIRISHARHGGPDEAKRVLAQALAELQAGTSFEDVSQKYSDSVMQANGGNWDWIQPDSISDPALRKTLASITVGSVADPIAGPQAFLIVKLTGKKAAYTTPFEETQLPLAARIRERKRSEQIAAIVDKVKSTAVIETMFDDETPPAQRQVSPVSGENTPSAGGQGPNSHGTP